jgi:phosphoenolpyruvate phosphomutase
MNEQLRDRADDLKRRLYSPHDLLRVVGAHNVLGAQLIEQAGFDGLWAGSLEITTACGRVDDDSSILTDILPVARLLAGRSRLPVIADGGTGADTPQGIAMLVRALERAGVAAVSLEDGCRPKSNSLLPGEHPLASVDEFAEKINAAHAACETSSFTIIARVEALIAHAGLGEALWRARAYAAAGADAILIHSKARTPDEIMAFVEAWDEPVPLVVVPTTYYTMTVPDLRRTGKVRMVIYANQGIRAIMRAMKCMLETVMRDGSTERLERHLATLDEVFALQRQFGQADTGEPCHHCEAVATATQLHDYGPSDHEADESTRMDGLRTLTRR